MSIYNLHLPLRVTPYGCFNAMPVSIETKLIEGLKQLLADTKAIPADVALMDGLKAKGYRVTQFSPVITGAQNDNKENK